MENRRENLQSDYDRIYRENSKKRLLKNLEKKFKTTMIGALARFEDGFGHLWGHGKDELTEREAEYRRVWEEVRTEILNNGNTQMRGAQDEVSHYTMSWDKYHTQFIVKKED